MAKAPKAGIRVVEGRRINLTELRKRRKLARERAVPIEDTRVVDTWARTEAKAASAKLDRAEIQAIKRLPPKIITYKTKVDNPEFTRDHKEEYAANHKKTPATINAKESAVSAMFARKLLDEAQALSATRFRMLWETLGGKGAGALDYSKEPVDGGKIAEPIDLRQMQAGIELKRCRELLGERGYKLVSQVCGEGYQISELVDGKRAQLSLMDALRGFLDDLSVMWRYSTDAQQKRFAVRK